MLFKRFISSWSKPAQSFDVICLANSTKHGGRCVAGLRMDGGGWVRAVSPSDDGTLERKHYTLADGSEARVLDLVRMEFKEHRPKNHQPENWVIAKSAWKLLARPVGPEAIPILQKFLVNDSPLFGDERDRIPIDRFASTPNPASLALIKPQSFNWRIRELDFGKRQPRGIFRCNPCTYDLSITDPIWNQRVSQYRAGTNARNAGLHPLKAAGFEEDNEILLSLSLGEPFEGACFKLIAGIIPLPPSWNGKLQK